MCRRHVFGAFVRLGHGSTDAPPGVTAFGPPLPGLAWPFRTRSLAQHARKHTAPARVRFDTHYRLTARATAAAPSNVFVRQRPTFRSIQARTHPPTTLLPPRHRRRHGGPGAKQCIGVHFFPSRILTTPDPLQNATEHHARTPPSRALCPLSGLWPPVSEGVVLCR
jgi:hypothetical protein